MKYGNPEGTNSFSVGIALPQILLKRENQVKVMLLVLVIMVILIPAVLIYWNSDMNSVDEEGALVKNHGNILHALNENLSINNVLSIVSTCWEFQRHPTKSTELPPLEAMLSQIPQS